MFEVKLSHKDVPKAPVVSPDAVHDAGTDPAMVRGLLAVW